MTGGESVSSAGSSTSIEVEAVESIPVSDDEEPAPHIGRGRVAVALVALGLVALAVDHYRSEVVG